MSDIIDTGWRPAGGQYTRRTLSIGDRVIVQIDTVLVRGGGSYNARYVRDEERSGDHTTREAAEASADAMTWAYAIDLCRVLGITAADLQRSE